MLSHVFLEVASCEAASRPPSPYCCKEAFFEAAFFQAAFFEVALWVASFFVAAFSEADFSEARIRSHVALGPNSGLRSQLVVSCAVGHIRVARLKLLCLL